MVFIFKAQTWNFVCGIRRSFIFTMENILSIWYTATPGWTSKFGKVWKTRCQNAATRANLWRCLLVSWDDKYLWVMVSNNRHELYFCSKLLCFSSIHCFFGQIRYLNIRHERTLTSPPLMLKCSERCRETQEREPAHTGWCLNHKNFHDISRWGHNRIDLPPYFCSDGLYDVPPSHLDTFLSSLSGYSFVSRVFISA